MCIRDRAETGPTIEANSAPTEQPDEETTVPVVEETPDLHVVPPQQVEAAEELADQPHAASYTADMDVSEITPRMMVDEAKTVVVQIGTCRGWTLEPVSYTHLNWSFCCRTCWTTRLKRAGV